MSGAGETRALAGREAMASVVVFLVALPLCMGVAIASGVPPALGLVTGIVGGILVGTLAGSPLQVSGPAAGLAVLCWQFVDTYGLAMLGVAVLAAGVLQLAAGILRLGQLFRAVSSSVVQGMLGGIGVLIFASQFHVMVDDAPRATGTENLLSIPQALYKGVLPLDGSSHHLAAALGLLTIVSIVAWDKLKPKKLASVPGPLIAVVAATAVAAVLGMPVRYVDVPEQLGASLNIPALSSFSMLLDGGFLGATIAMGLIASAETLLCATAVDQLHTGPRTDYDKELRAQGIGNIVCGVVGALPMTGVIVRSSANVGAGATTRWSAVLHGVWLLGLVVAAPFVLRAIPTASLAAILVYTGYRLLAPQGFALRWRTSKVQFAVYAITVVAIVGTDLLTGVAVGFALSLLELLARFARVEIETLVLEDGRHEVRIRGAATFLGVPRIAAALEALPHGERVRVHLAEVGHVDPSSAELFHGWRRTYEATGGEVELFEAPTALLAPAKAGPGGH